MSSNIRFRTLVGPSDRVVRRPIKLWCQNLKNEFSRVLRPGEDLNKDELAQALNNLALIAALEGNFDCSMNLCAYQIDLWGNLADVSGDSYINQKILQPWINLGRLHRWSGQVKKTIEFYSMIAPSMRDERIPIARKRNSSLNELVAGPNSEQLQSILDTVYWVEYGDFLLKNNDIDLLSAHFQNAVRCNVSPEIKWSLMEMLFVGHANSGCGAEIVPQLEKFKKAKGKFGIAFLLLKIQLLFEGNKFDFNEEWEQTWTVISSESFWGRSAVGLANIASFTHAVSNIEKYDAEVELLKRWNDLAVSLDDELFLFECNQRMIKLGMMSPEVVAYNFKDSQYQEIKRKLNIGNNKKYYSTFFLPLISSLSVLNCGAFKQQLEDIVL